MALLCRVVAAPSSSCVAAARWFLGIEEPLNETETERELQTEQRREHLQSWSGLPQLGGEDNGQGWNRKGGDVCSVHLLDSGVTNICLCGLPLNEEGVGGIWLCWYRWRAKSVGVVGWPWSASTRLVWTTSHSLQSSSPTSGSNSWEPKRYLVTNKLQGSASKLNNHLFQYILQFYVVYLPRSP